MQDGLYVISGETFDAAEVIAGAKLFKKIKKALKKLGKFAAKIAAPALGIASIAMPALAPAAAAAAIATKVMKGAKRGHRPARAAMRMMGRSADRGDVEAQRFMNIAQRVATPAPQTLLNAAQVRELALRARQGNPQARDTLSEVAELADNGDESAQTVLEQAAGTARWDLVAGQSLNQDLEILESGCTPRVASGYEEIISGGPLWNYFAPHKGFRTSQQVWSPRDAYRLGIEAAPFR
jgi:hypothetical protein